MTEEKIKMLKAIRLIYCMKCGNRKDKANCADCNVQIAVNQMMDTLEADDES